MLLQGGPPLLENGLSWTAERCWVKLFKTLGACPDIWLFWLGSEVGDRLQQHDCSLNQSFLYVVFIDIFKIKISIRTAWHFLCSQSTSSAEKTCAGPNFISGFGKIVQGQKKGRPCREASAGTLCWKDTVHSVYSVLICIQADQWIMCAKEYDQSCAKRILPLISGRLGWQMRARKSTCKPTEELCWQIDKRWFLNVFEGFGGSRYLILCRGVDGRQYSCLAYQLRAEMVVWECGDGSPTDVVKSRSGFIILNWSTIVNCIEFMLSVYM